MSFKAYPEIYKEWVKSLSQNKIKIARQQDLEHGDGVKSCILQI